MTATKTYSTTFPAVSLEEATGGMRVRREGKGDTLFVTRDERVLRNPTTHLIIMHGQGVVGRVTQVDGEWVIERGIFRNWDYNKGIYQAFPSSTVETYWGFATMTEAVAHEAIYWLS